MTTRNEYLKLCLENPRVLESKNWYVSALSIPFPGPVSLEEKMPYELVAQPTGMHYVSELHGEKSLVRIIDHKPDTPLFHISDVIEVDVSWHPCLKGVTSTRLGNLLINVVAIYPALKNKIGYQDGPIGVSKLENKIAVLIKDDEDIKNPDQDVRVQEYLDCMDRLWFFTKLANLVSIASTQKTVTAPDGMAELRKKLLTENKDKLTDPVVVADIVSKFNQYDMEYLKDDPAASKILGRKGNTARKKLYQMYGETLDFDTSLGSKPILTPMVEGANTSSDVFPKYMNDLRYASYSRGHSTQLSGYGYKILQRALASLSIVDTPCATTRGFTRLIDKKNQEKIVGRYVKDQGWKLINTPEQAGKYLGKSVEIRSPMYCRSGNNSYCYACLGENFKGSGAAMTNIAANLSGELMTLFLKQMHTSGFSLTDLDIEDLVT